MARRRTVSGESHTKVGVFVSRRSLAAVKHLVDCGAYPNLSAAFDHALSLLRLMHTQALADAERDSEERVA